MHVKHLPFLTAVLVLGSTGSAWAACVQTYDQQFIGQKCDDPGIVQFSGTFSDVSGGTLNGERRIDYTTSGDHRAATTGSLRTTDFLGTLTREENKNGAVTSITE
ncbi:MAG: hypothetical protein Q7R45_03430, partial [Sulfuricaulis sp.]|nr:hypothetical protein [Sulfuricaulis sp.]